MRDDIPYSVNDMLILIINYVHLDMVLLHLFITDTERYMCCYSNNGLYYKDEDWEEDYEEEDTPPTIENTKESFVRGLVLNQYFLYTSSMLKSLDKVGQDIVDKVISEFDEMEKCWKSDDAELFESAWRNLWSAWKNFANKFYKEYGYTVVLPN